MSSLHYLALNWMRYTMWPYSSHALLVCYFANMHNIWPHTSFQIMSARPLRWAMVSFRSGTAGCTLAIKQNRQYWGSSAAWNCLDITCVSVVALVLQPCSDLHSGPAHDDEQCAKTKRTCSVLAVSFAGPCNKQLQVS